jgi:hypothetical protein
VGRVSVLGGVGIAVLLLSIIIRVRVRIRVGNESSLPRDGSLVELGVPSGKVELSDRDTRALPRYTSTADNDSLLQAAHPSLLALLTLLASRSLLGKRSGGSAGRASGDGHLAEGAFDFVKRGLGGRLMLSRGTVRRGGLSGFRREGRVRLGSGSIGRGRSRSGRGSGLLGNGGDV